MNNARGNVVLVIAVSLAVLSALVDTVLTHYDTGVNNFRAFNDKTRAFYVSEGTRAIATVLIENYLQKNPLADDQAIKDYVTNSLQTLLPPGYTVPPDQVTVHVLSQQQDSIIPNGPFAGMNGPVTNLQVKYNVVGDATNGSVVEPLDLQLSVGYISMFQFMMFYDVPKAALNTGPTMVAIGRVHSNNDFCIGGTGPNNTATGQEYWQKLTVAGGLFANTTKGCPLFSTGQGGGSNQISTDGLVSNNQIVNTVSMTSANDHSCTNCKNTKLSWQAYALATWHGQAQDSAHGVQRLTLPGAGMGLTQTSVAGGWSAVNNSTNLRFIIDPVQASDSSQVLQYKFAAQADVRIINGVWYLRDPMGAPWPGVPIWSDHPGQHTLDAFGLPVGQGDLATKWGWATTPTNFSYYEYGTGAQTIANDATGTGVISYGQLIPTGNTTTPFKPGHWAGGSNSPICFRTPSPPCSGTSCNFQSALTALSCGTSPATTVATGLLNGTRSGFVDGHDQAVSPGAKSVALGRSNLLPINFDVAQFQTALQNTAPGELGSYFGTLAYMGTSFNGIVYIDSEWPGSLGDAPAEAPPHGGIADSSQIPATSPSQDRALPQTLCSSDNALIGQPFDSGYGTSRFKIPDCANYQIGYGTATSSWPNAVRVINGTNLDPKILTQGVSLITRLPAFVLGDFNSKSDTTDSKATPWVSALVGGDKVGLLSNAWTDQLSFWSAGGNYLTTYRNASQTTYKMAMLSDPSEVLTNLYENWDGVDLNYNGSMVFGYQRVFANHGNSCCSTTTYWPPNRKFTFDTHFNLINNQPPGTPVFPVAATITWSK